jgi:hypothetical protein
MADWLGGAAGLWCATLLHKAAVLGFSFWVGHSLGADGVGVMASTLAIVWVVSTVAGWGFPDRAPFMGSSRDRTPQSRRLYGMFVALVILVHGLLLMAAEHVSGVNEPVFLALSQGLIWGAGCQCLSAVGFAWLRGSGQPRAEIIATIAASLVLLAGPFLGIPLGTVWAASGIPLVAGSFWRNDFLPDWPRIASLVEYAKKGSMYLVFGLGSWVLGNIDILLGRLLYDPDFVGELQVGTMAVRGMAIAPWLAATFMLRPTRHAWARGDQPTPWSWVLSGGGVGILVGGVSWLAIPFLARGHAMTVAAIEHIAWVSILIAPTFYAMVLLLPLAAQWNMNRTLKAIGMGLIVQVGVGWASANSLNISTLVVVAGLGQFVTLMWLIQCLRSSSAQGFEMDGSTLTPRE